MEAEAGASAGSGFSWISDGTRAESVAMVRADLPKTEFVQSKVLSGNDSIPIRNRVGLRRLVVYSGSARGPQTWASVAAVFEDDTDVLVRFDDIVQADDVGVLLRVCMQSPSSSASR